MAFLQSDINQAGVTAEAELFVGSPTEPVPMAAGTARSQAPWVLLHGKGSQGVNPKASDLADCP